MNTKARSLNPLPIGSLFPTTADALSRVAEKWSQSPSYRVTLSDISSASLLPSRMLRLNPLPIGSLFPTDQIMNLSSKVQTVSIPFLSGHSFRPSTVTALTSAGAASQSPSYRVTLSDAGRPWTLYRLVGVSIPFLSGHSFRRKPGGWKMSWTSMMSQSPSYRVTLSDNNRRLLIPCRRDESQSPSYRVTLSDWKKERSRSS